MATFKTFKPGDLVRISSTGRLGVIIDRTPPSTWGVLQFNYPNCSETRFSLSWLKYRAKISIAALDRKYFLNYYPETVLDFCLPDLKTPNYNHLFFHPQNIKYTVGDLVTVRTSSSGSFFHAGTNPLKDSTPETSALVLKAPSNNAVVCLVDCQDYLDKFNISQYNLPKLVKNWKSIYTIMNSAIIRKLSHYNLKPQPCGDCRLYEI